MNQPPRKPTNQSRRSREHLTANEIERLITSAKHIGRHGYRNATMILLAFRHGLRVSELTALRWNQVDLKQSLLHVSRKKHGIPSTHPLWGPELRALRKIAKDYPETTYVFVSQRKGPITDSMFRKIVAKAGDDAALGLPIHPQMLRHSTGFKLANDGQDTRAIQLYLGHRNIQHTVKYTQLAAGRFKDFWDD